MKEETITGQCLARHFLGIQLSSVGNDSDNVYSPPGTETPADGTAEVRSGAIPLPRLSASGTLCPGNLRPLRRISSKGGWQGAMAISSPCALPLLFLDCILYIFASVIRRELILYS